MVLFLLSQGLGMELDQVGCEEAADCVEWVIPLVGSRELIWCFQVLDPCSVWEQEGGIWE